jgi:hypothetical protein
MWRLVVGAGEDAGSDLHLNKPSHNADSCSHLKTMVQLWLSTYR